MKLQISKLAVPELEFGGPGYFHDPRTGLLRAGPFDLRFGAAHKTQVRVAVVGPQEMNEKVQTWFMRCSGEIPALSSEGTQPAFPGFASVFRSALSVEPSWFSALDERELQHALSLRPYEGFQKVVSLYEKAISIVYEDFRPDVVVCAISETISKRFWSVQRELSKSERSQLFNSAKKSAADQIELPFDWEPDESVEDLLRRDLRRALKAIAMRIGVPIQLLRDSGMLDSKANEEAAARAWNLTTALYYKAGGIPWRMRSRGPESCFVGITFHHLRTTKRALVHSALAQAFSTNGGGFALRGSTLDPEPSGSRRTPHLNEEQAAALGAKVLSEYVARNGVAPKRIVLHKSSRFTPQERDGFNKALKDVPKVQLLALMPASTRLVTHASYPPSRGTLLTVNDSRHFLFTSGYLPELQTYPGPHIPIPVELVADGDATEAEVREMAIDALGLGRLNWNSSDLRSSQPVTLGFARKVGGIMAEFGQISEQEPEPSYRYYM